MDWTRYDQTGHRSAEFVGRPPPSDQETVWIDDDYVLDLMIALCDLLYEDGCHGSSYLFERAIDLFLFEIGRTPSPRWRTSRGSERVPREDVANIFAGQVGDLTPSDNHVRTKPSRSNKVFQSKNLPRRAAYEAAKVRQETESDSVAREICFEQQFGRDIEHSNIGHRRTDFSPQTAGIPSESFLGTGHSPYTISISPADPKVVLLKKLRRSLRY